MTATPRRMRWTEEEYHREPGGAWDLTHLSDGAVRLPDLGGVMLLEELYLSDGP